MPVLQLMATYSNKRWLTQKSGVVLTGSRWQSHSQPGWVDVSFQLSPKLRGLLSATRGYSVLTFEGSPLGTGLLSPGSLRSRTSKMALRPSGREDACCCHESPTDLGQAEVRANAPSSVPHTGGENWSEIALHSVDWTRPAPLTFSSLLSWGVVFFSNKGSRDRKEKRNRATQQASPAVSAQAQAEATWVQVT